MNVYRMLLVVGIVFLQASGANAQFGGFGNLIKKALNVPVNPPTAADSNATPANPPGQETVANPPAPTPPASQTEQNSQVTNPPMVQAKSADEPKENELVETPQTTTDVTPTNNVVSQSGQDATAPPKIIKAYKTLNFGDDDQTVKDKLAEIFGSNTHDYSGNPSDSDETFWRTLFDSDAEYEPYKYYQHSTDPSDKFQLLRDYFTIKQISQGNDVISVDCYQLEKCSDNNGFMGLAVVKVSYTKYDLDKLVASFIQNYPNARKGNEHHKSELIPYYPGAFYEYDKPTYSDINQDRIATLTLPLENSTVTFTDKSQLSDSDKTSLIETMKNSSAGDPPIALFAYKKMIDFHMNNYRQSIEAADQAQKAKLKQESDSSTGF